MTISTRGMPLLVHCWNNFQPDSYGLLRVQAFPLSGPQLEAAVGVSVPGVNVAPLQQERDRAFHVCAVGLNAGLF